MVLRLCYSGGAGNKIGFNKGKHWSTGSVIVCIIYIINFFYI